MNKFLKKTKKTFTLMGDSIKETTGNSKLVDDPEFAKKAEGVEKYKKAIKTLRADIRRLATLYKDAAKAHGTVAAAYLDAFTAGMPSKVNMTTGTKEATEQYTVVVTNLAQLLEVHAVRPLSDLETEIRAIKTVMDKRHKNLVLLEKAKKDLAHAREKGKEKNIPAHEAEVEKRQAKFDRYDNNFQEAFAKFDSTQGEIFTKSYMAYQYYWLSFQRVTTGIFDEKLTAFPSTEARESLPPLDTTPLPPLAEEKKKPKTEEKAEEHKE